MKKISVFAWAMFLMVYTASSQEFYLWAGLGYAVPQAGQTLDGTGTPYAGTQNNSSFLQTYNLKNASFSAGLQGSVALGYMFNNFFGIQLGVDAATSPRKYSYQINNVNVDLGQGAFIADITTTQQASLPAVVVPSIVIQTGSEGLNAYCRFGPALPISSKISQGQFIENAPNTVASVSTYDFTYSVKNSFSLGVAAAAGVKYKLNDRISIWGEMSILSMSLYIKQADLKSFVYDGQSYPLSNITSPHTYYYSKNASIDSTGINQPTYSQPFSNVGFKVGIYVALSHHERRRARNEADMDNTKPFRRR